MKMIIWAFRECGVDTPSFYALRKMQKSLRQSQGIPSLEQKSVQGNVFYVNDPREIIAQDWNNPAVRDHIRVYPEIPNDGIIREVWHAEKWRKTMDLDLLSPMYDAGYGRHYYVFELSRLKSGEFVIPIRWVTWKNQVCADAFAVEIDSNGIATIHDSEPIPVESKDLNSNYLDLQHEGAVPEKWSETAIATKIPSKMPNHYHEVAKGEPLYVSFIDYFGDDVSGNRSKSWNKHNNSYLTHWNLPRKLLHQEYHVHLVSTSQHATISEQYHEVKKIVEKTRTEPVRVSNSDGSGTRVMLQPHACPSDNPAQSDIAAHIGAKGNYPCRKCKAGGTEEHKCTDHGFASMFEPGELRDASSVLEELGKQVKLACTGVAKHVSECQTNSGTKDMFTQYWIDHLISRFHAEKKSNPNSTKAAIQKSLTDWCSENKDKIYSGFLTTQGFDPTRDTPVEILHTILLGVVKYIWHYSNTQWKKDSPQRLLYAQRLQATDTHGLSLNPIQSEYIIQFANSLIGRQFKTIIQTAVFHVHDLLDANHFAVWKAVTHLSALLWFVEIDHMDQYCKDLEAAVANAQDAFAAIDPTKIVRKIKIHLLAHIPEDARAFGSLLGVATELFEKFNTVFRNCSVLSNHLAPSRDISRQLGDQEAMKHRLLGGKWFDDTEKSWMQPGPSLLALSKDQPFLRAMVGWSIDSSSKPGTVIKIPLTHKRKLVNRDVKLDQTSGRDAVNRLDFDGDCIWTKCKTVTTTSGDDCSTGCWVFCHSPIQDSNQTILSRVDVILTNAHGVSVAILEQFEISAEKDTFFDLPYLFRRQGEVSFIIVPSSNLLFIQNVQHDCRTGKCRATGIQNRKQERLETDQIEHFIEHQPVDRYFINLYAFHNAHLVRRTLPRNLTTPMPVFLDRAQERARCAKTLRDLLAPRKEQTQKKRQETAQRKAAEKRGESTAASSSNVAEATPNNAQPRPRPNPRKRQRVEEEREDSAEMGEGLES
ncbi:hypothetical protein VKT23_012663 [Stygiomarasmius scandens]|uniref:Uncharacterized protein n=1 Tax=Marasmiellus scandens TaxID=2682957 RepID=A0ABR1J5W3_9AGAR